MAYETANIGAGHSRRLAAHRDDTGRANYGRDGQSLGEPGATPASASAPVKAAKPAGAGFAPNPGAAFGYHYTKADLDAAATKAAAQAVAQERARIAAVFATDASKGRERVCATLLTAPNGFTAAAIAKHLATMPKDRDVAARQAGTGTEADAGWAKAYDADREPPAPATPAEASADAGDTWARAYAATGTPTAKAQPRAESSWDRAYASTTRAAR